MSGWPAPLLVARLGVQLWRMPVEQAAEGGSAAAPCSPGTPRHLPRHWRVARGPALDRDLGMSARQDGVLIREGHPPCGANVSARPT